MTTTWMRQVVRRFIETNTNLFLLAGAAFLALLFYGLITLWPAADVDAPALVAARVAFVAALFLMSFDVLAGAHIANHDPRNLRDPHFWIHAFYLGYFWWAMMVLLNWDSIATPADRYLHWAVPAAVFGLFMAFVMPQDGPDLRNRYDLEKPTTGHAIGFLYYLWPLVVAGVIAGLLAFPPASGWSDNYLMFQIVFLGAIMPLYPLRAGRFWQDSTPRLLGTALLLLGLLVL